MTASSVVRTGPLGRLLTIRRLVAVVLMTAAWCVLWGSVSVANVAAGLVVALGIGALGVGTDLTGGVRLRPLLAFAGIVAVDLVRSTINVAVEILTPTDYTEESIVAVELQPEARHHLLLLIVAVTVTPGTAVVDADPDTGTLYLHLLHHDRREETAAHVHQLADLACRALPVAGASRRGGGTTL